MTGEEVLEKKREFCRKVLLERNLGGNPIKENNLKK
jgi:hypothetical protein